MRLITKYKHAGTFNKEWVKDRDINGNWGSHAFNVGFKPAVLSANQLSK